MQHHTARVSADFWSAYCARCNIATSKLRHESTSLGMQPDCDIPLDFRHIAAEVMLGEMTAPKSLLPGSFLLSFPSARAKTNL